MTNRICQVCANAIPSSRRAHSRYCSNTCYMIAKKQRAVLDYGSKKDLLSSFNKNERLLAQFYPLSESKHPISYGMLNALGFDWGISQSEKQDAKKNIWKGIGQYYYFINPDKTILIWKDSTLLQTK